MKDEVAAAVVFLSRLVKRNKELSKDMCDKFSDKLTNILVDKFKNHWHTDSPHKGQAYRCIRINEFEPVDPVLSQAAKESGLEFSQLKMPCELTLWVDPSEVACRIGENKGSFVTVASFRKDQTDNHALTLDVEEMIGEYNKKKTEDFNKLREFTGKRSPVNLPGGNHANIYKNVHHSHGIATYQQYPIHPHNPHYHQAKWRNSQYNINNHAKVFNNGLHVFHSSDYYQPQQSSSDEEGNMFHSGAVYSNLGSNNKSVISSTSSQQTVTQESSAAPVNMKTGQSNLNHASGTGVKADRYRWVKGTEPVKA